jgi:hypothetical protein
MTDNHGYVLSPLPVAPVNETDMVLLPKGLQALKKVAKPHSIEFRGYPETSWHLCRVLTQPPRGNGKQGRDVEQACST